MQAPSSQRHPIAGGLIGPSAAAKAHYPESRDDDNDDDGDHARDVKQVRFDLERNTVAVTYHRDDYNRSEPEDEELQHEAVLSWHEHEEDRERHRQLMTRWQEIERYLPPGIKCKERLQHEQQNLQSVEQQLTARLHAFAQNHNNQSNVYSQQSSYVTPDSLLPGMDLPEFAPKYGEREPFQHRDGRVICTAGVDMPSRQPQPSLAHASLMGDDSSAAECSALEDSTWDVDTASAPVALVSTGERGVAVAPWGELAVVSSEPSTDPGAGGGSQVDMLVERMRAMELMLAAERQKVQELQAANEAETREARRRSSMGAAGINLSWDMGHLDHVSPLVPQESAGANGEGGVGSIDTLVKDSASGLVVDMSAAAAKKLKQKARKISKQKEKELTKQRERDAAAQKVEERRLKTVQKAQKAAARKARAELVKQTKKKHKAEIKLLSTLDPEVLEEERAAKKTRAVVRRPSTLEPTEPVATAPKQSRFASLRRSRSLQGSKKDEQVAAGEVKVKRRLSLSSLASTFRRRSFRAPKAVTAAPAQAPAPALRPVGGPLLSSNHRNVRLSSLAPVDAEPVGRGGSQASKIVRAASWAKIRRGGSTNVLKDVTSDSPTKTATKIPIPTFPAAGGLSHMRSPSRSFANNSILSLDTSFDVTIHQSTAV